MTQNDKIFKVVNVKRAHCYTVNYYNYAATALIWKLFNVQIILLHHKFDYDNITTGGLLTFSAHLSN